MDLTDYYRGVSERRNGTFLPPAKTEPMTPATVRAKAAREVNELKDRIKRLQADLEKASKDLAYWTEIAKH